MEKRVKNSTGARCIACDTPLQIYIPAISDDRYGCPGIFSISRCPECGQMATMPPLNESDLPGLYSRYYPRRDVDFEALDIEAKRAIAPAARLRRWFAGTDNQGHYRAQPGQKVLDIGSGSCLALLELREMGVEAFGVEADPNVRPIADRFGLTVHIGSIHDHPFAGESFDLIVLNQVIEHVPDPMALLRVVKVRLNAGGRVVLSFPNTASLQAARSGVCWINWHVPYHQHHFNRESFSRLAARAGYTVTDVRTITPNLWTLLQLRASREAPVEGRVSANWSGDRTNLAKAGFLARVERALRARIALVLTTFAATSNRLWDAAGRGDSLLIELRIADKGRS